MLRGRIGSVRIHKIVMVKQKLGNKQNDVRDDSRETRVVIEVVATSLAAEQIKASRIGVHIVLTIPNEKTVMVTKLHCRVRCCDILLWKSVMQTVCQIRYMLVRVYIYVLVLLSEGSSPEWSTFSSNVT